MGVWGCEATLDLCPESPILQTPPAVGPSPRAPQLGAAPGRPADAAGGTWPRLACLPLPGGGAPRSLSCQPGARTGGESLVNSECDEKCCLCPKAKEAISSGPGIKPFRKGLSSLMPMPRCLGHRFRARAGSGMTACPHLPQAPSCPALLPATPGPWPGGTTGFPTEDPCQKQPTGLHPQLPLVQVAGAARSSILQAPNTSTGGRP